MSGAKYNNISRKDFLKISSLGALLALLYTRCKPSEKKEIPIRFSGADFKRGHRLRNPEFPEPEKTIFTDTLIIGSGVSGLSAARHLYENDYKDFVVLELDTQIGGNSKGGKNTISAFPFGAHYLPVANEKFKDLTDFLLQHNIITGFGENGLPIYNEYYLCAEPQERLHIRGMWQDGLPPKAGLTIDEQRELITFLSITEGLKNKTGSDGKPAFTIPLEWSSNDETFLKYDKISAWDFLQEQHFKTDFIYWYIDYCCKDDFGISLKKTSAWAMLHYFSSRNGKAHNAESHEQLTWPEGNFFLVNCLAKNIQEKIQNNKLVYQIEKNNTLWHCKVFDFTTGKSSLYTTNHLIMATPQYVNKHVLTDTLSTVQWDTFEYYPWLVANISIKDKKVLNGSGDLSWNNVFYRSSSLGYVNAGHQIHNRLNQKTVLTYYFNFCENTAQAERNKIFSINENEWKNFIIADLKKAHSTIEEQIEEIEIQLWGHGMISPTVGFRTSPSREQLSSTDNNIYFINSDVSGISLFEEAFYKGIEASKSILKKKKSNAKA